MYLKIIKIPSRWKYTVEQRDYHTVFHFRTWLKAPASEPPDYTIEITNWNLSKLPRPQESKPADIKNWLDESFATIRQLLENQVKQERSSISEDSSGSINPDGVMWLVVNTMAIAAPVTTIARSLINHNQCPYTVKSARWSSNQPPRSYLQLIKDDGSDAGCCVCSSDDNQLWVASISDHRLARRLATKGGETAKRRGGMDKSKIWESSDKIKLEYMQMLAEPKRRFKMDILSTLSKRHGKSTSTIKRILKS